MAEDNRLANPFKFLGDIGGLALNGLKPANVKDIYNALGGSYDTVTHMLDKISFGEMRTKMLAHAYGDVLEIAVGSGKNLRYYQPDQCSRIVGLDFSRQMLALAKERADHSRIPFEAYEGDATKLAYDNRSFDTVVCTLGCCTFNDPQAVIAEMRRVVKDDGRVIFIEHVRPKTAGMLRFCQTIAPFTRRALGCDPLRPTDETIARSGLRVEVRISKMNEMLLGLVTVSDV